MMIDLKYGKVLKHKILINMKMVKKELLGRCLLSY